MRETKFRIKYLGVEASGIPSAWAYITLPYDLKGELYHDEGSYDWDTFSQYAGFKDKNGKEVYEGDLLRENYKAGYSIYQVCFGLYDNEEDYEGSIRGIGWYITEHAFMNSGYQENLCEMIDFSKFEVIGNRFQNPELLEQT